MPVAEPLVLVVARQVRGRMGEIRISGNRLAPLMGMSQAAFSRRTIGDHPFSLAEIEQLAELLNVNVGYLLGLEMRRSPRPISDEGLRSSELVVRHEGLEPPTRWLSTCPSWREPNATPAGTAVASAPERLGSLLPFRPAARHVDAAAGTRTPLSRAWGSSSCESAVLATVTAIGDAS